MQVGLRESTVSRQTTPVPSRRWRNGSRHDRYYPSWRTHRLSNAVSIPDMCCVWWTREKRATDTERGNRVLLSVTLSLRVKKRALCSQVSYALVTMPEGGGGGSGGWVWQQQAMLTGCHTCFQQHYLIVLTQLHEAIDALGKLHHILNGLRYFDSTQLPHDFSGLRTDRIQNGFRAIDLNAAANVLVLIELPYSGSSPPPLAERPARSSAAAPPSGTDMSPCATWRCSGPGVLKHNHQQKPITSQLRSECCSHGCVKVKTSHMKYATGKADLFTELSSRRRGGYT